MGLHDDIMMPFGKLRGTPVGHTPDSYLKWCLEQDWFEKKYEDLIDIFQEELNWREQWDLQIRNEGEVIY